MRRILMLAAAFCFLSAFEHNPGPAYYNEVFTGRLEIKGPCNQRVVSIISSNAESAEVDHRWRDPLTKEVYEYSFSVKNFCDLRNLGEGETFTFRFTRPYVRNACPSCLMYRPVPDTDRFVTVLHRGSMAPMQISHKE